MFSTSDMFEKLSGVSTQLILFNIIGLYYQTKSKTQSVDIKVKNRFL